MPTRGDARTFGVPTGRLDFQQLGRIGVIPHNPSFLAWMTVGQQLDYLADFYPRWDGYRQRDLVDLLDFRLESGIRGLSAEIWRRPPSSPRCAIGLTSSCSMNP